MNGKGYSYTSETFDISKIEQAGPDLYKASTSEMFILEDANGQKTNNSRQKTYLIHVLGQNHFTIRDITEVSKSTTEVQDRTVGLVTDNDFDRFISGYYSNYAQAFNGSGFSTVATFYDPQTQEYKDTEANIADAISKQMKMNVVWSTVESSSVKDDSHYLVQVDSEIEYHYQNGTGDRKKLRTEFLIEVTPNAQLLIQSLPSMTILEKTSL